MHRMATQLKLDFSTHACPSTALVLGMLDQIEICCHGISEQARLALGELWCRVERALPCLPHPAAVYVDRSLDALGMDHRARSRATKAIVQMFLADVELCSVEMGATPAEVPGMPKKPPQAEAETRRPGSTRPAPARRQTRG